MCIIHIDGGRREIILCLMADDEVLHKINGSKYHIDKHGDRRYDLHAALLIIKSRKKDEYREQEEDHIRYHHIMLKYEHAAESRLVDESQVEEFRHPVGGFHLSTSAVSRCSHGKYKTEETDCGSRNLVPFTLFINDGEYCRCRKSCHYDHCRLLAVGCEDKCQNIKSVLIAAYFFPSVSPHRA